jgi:hypothetical protein
MTCLINGCSFSAAWKPDSDFLKHFSQTDFLNISKTGASFKRSARTTMEWVAQNGKPGLVILPITYAHRFEMAVSNTDDALDGAWFPMQRSELIDQNKIHDSISAEKLKTMLDLYYGSVADVRHFWETLFSDIITLSAWLEKQNIPYIMFDMCNDFSKEHIQNLKGIARLKYIYQNENIIDLFSFCGNKIMWESLDEKTRSKVDSIAYHHANKQFRVLENNIIKSLTKV